MLGNPNPNPNPSPSPNPSPNPSPSPNPNPNPNTGARSSLRLLVEALAVGAAAQLPLTELDISHNELRDGGLLAVATLVAALPHGLKVRMRPP